MVKAIKGTLIETEASIKEVVLALGEAEHFVIEDIDDNHIFITRNASQNIKERVNKVMTINKD